MSEKKKNIWLVDQAEFEKFIDLIIKTSDSDHHQIVCWGDRGENELSQLIETRHIFRDNIIHYIKEKEYIPMSHYDYLLFDNDLKSAYFEINPNALNVKDAVYVLAKEMVEYMRTGMENGYSFFYNVEEIIAECANETYKIFDIKKTPELKIKIDENLEKVFFSIFGKYGDKVYNIIESHNSYYVLVNAHLVDLNIAKHNKESAVKIRKDWYDHLYESFYCVESPTVPIPGTLMNNVKVKLLK